MDAPGRFSIYNATPLLWLTLPRGPIGVSQGGAEAVRAEELYLHVDAPHIIPLRRSA